MVPTIWRFKIPIELETIINIPTNANIVNVMVDPGDGEIYLYAACYADNKKEIRTFTILRTGEKVIKIDGRGMSYLNTVFKYNKLDASYITYHVFETYDEATEAAKFEQFRPPSATT